MRSARFDRLQKLDRQQRVPPRLRLHVPPGQARRALLRHELHVGDFPLGRELASRLKATAARRRPTDFRGQRPRVLARFQQPDHLSRQRRARPSHVENQLRFTQQLAKGKDFAFGRQRDGTLLSEAVRAERPELNWSDDRQHLPPRREDSAGNVDLRRDRRLTRLLNGQTINANRPEAPLQRAGQLHRQRPCRIGLAGTTPCEGDVRVICHRVDFDTRRNRERDFRDRCREDLNLEERLKPQVFLAHDRSEFILVQQRRLANERVVARSDRQPTTPFTTELNPPDLPLRVRTVADRACFGSRADDPVARHFQFDHRHCRCGNNQIEVDLTGQPTFCGTPCRA